MAHPIAAFICVTACYIPLSSNQRAMINVYLFCIRLYSLISTATIWILLFLIPCKNGVSSQSLEHGFLQQSPPLTILWPKSTRKKEMWDNYRTPVPNWCWDRPMMVDDGGCAFALKSGQQCPWTIQLELRCSTKCQILYEAKQVLQ